MDIQLLGTGGADGIPALYSESRVSKFAREHRGKDIRSRASAIVDGTLKFDMGPDTWHQLVREGLDARDWSAIFFTHSDADHFAIEELQYCLYPFNDFEYAGYTIFGNEVIISRINSRYPDWPFELIKTKMFEPIVHGEYVVTPLMARHMQFEEAHNYLVQSQGKTLLYGTDTGIWADPTWEYLKQHRLDCLILECSEGFVLTPYNGHLDIEEFKEVVTKLRDLGIVDEKTRIVTTHHSHNGEATHAELEAELNPFGVEVGYDGLRVEF